jgi:antirestriction protein ArdC
MAYDTYQQITDKIIAMIEKGAGQWQMPWHSLHGEGLHMPRNPLSGTKYRGLNIAMLWGAGEAFGYRSQLWATYNQWRDAGAQVRKGEKSTLIFFWKRLEASARDDHGAVREDEDGRNVVFVARSYNVFAAEQVDGFTLAPTMPTDGLSDDARVAAADTYFAAIGARVSMAGTAPSKRCRPITSKCRNLRSSATRTAITQRSGMSTSTGRVPRRASTVNLASALATGLTRLRNSLPSLAPRISAPNWA